MKRKGRGGQYRFMIRNLGEAHSSVAAFLCLLRRMFFWMEGPVFSGRGKQRSGIGRGRLMPLVKWCWHAEGLLWEVVIHHDFRMTQSSTLLLGLWSGIHDWCEVHVRVGWKNEKETVCVYVLNISKDRTVVKLFLWRRLFNFPSLLFSCFVKEVNGSSTD